MLRLNKIFFLFFLLFFLIAACNRGKLIYDYGDEVASWQIDSFFDLTTQQEEWIEERMRMHLDWHRTEELPLYRSFLIEVQNRARDGLTMIELDEGYARLDLKRVRTLERLLPDTVSFLEELSAEQIDCLLYTSPSPRD